MNALEDGRLSICYAVGSFSRDYRVVYQVKVKQHH